MIPSVRGNNKHRSTSFPHRIRLADSWGLRVLRMNFRNYWLTNVCQHWAITPTASERTNRHLLVRIGRDDGVILNRRTHLIDSREWSTMLHQSMLFSDFLIVHSLLTGLPVIIGNWFSGKNYSRISVNYAELLFLQFLIFAYTHDTTNALRELIIQCSVFIRSSSMILFRNKARPISIPVCWIDKSVPCSRDWFGDACFSG